MAKKSEVGQPTGGTWITRNQSNLFLDVVTQERDHNDEQTVICATHPPQWLFGTPEHYANVYLLAAAPDLYEAIKAYLENVDWWDTYTTFTEEQARACHEEFEKRGDYEERLIAQLRAALRKAEGK